MRCDWINDMYYHMRSYLVKTLTENYFCNMCYYSIQENYYLPVMYLLIIGLLLILYIKVIL